MLDRIIKFSIKNKLIVGTMVLALVGWGIYSMQELPIDAVPDITNNQVQIITSAPSQSAQDIERLVTFPLEITMSSIPNIEEIRSFSRFGLSVVTVVFKDQIDIYWARQQIGERLVAAKNQIPANIGTPEMAPVTTGLGEIYQYTLYAKEGYEDKYSAMELRSIQDWIVRRQLLGIEGVADVSSFGGFLKQYEVAVNPERMLSLDVSVNEVFQALAVNNQNTGGAYIDKNPKAYFIRSQGLIQTPEDITNIVIKNTREGTPILIKDIGTVQLGSAVRYGAMTRNGEGEVVGAVVMMLKGANSSKVIANVTKRVAQIQQNLPEGVAIRPFLDRTKLVKKAIGTVTTNLIEGALIVLFILVILLGNLRAGLIVASVIPLAMLFAISLMKVFGVSGNLMSLGAIDFGIIVDGSVIIVEATLHYLGLKKSGTQLSQQQMDEQVYTSASKIRTSAAFGEIIILIVYLPILALVGIEGKMFRPMATTVSFAILGAFILSLTYVPMMSALCLKKTMNNKRTLSDRIMEKLQNVYTPILETVLRNRKKMVLVSLLVFAMSLFTFTQMGSEFIPSLDEGDFAIETRVSTGSSVSHTIDAVNDASKLLMKEFPNEVREVVGKIGSSEIPTDPMPIEAADMIVVLSEPDVWTKADSKDELAEKMQMFLEQNTVGVTFGFQQPIQMRFNELMTGARQDVVVKVYGEDLDQLVTYGNRIGALAQTIEGAEDLYVEEITGLKQIVIDYDRSQLALYGLNIEEVNTAVNTAFAGQRAGSVYEGEKRFDLVVRLDHGNRESIADIKKLYITTPRGVQIPLTNVARVDFKTGPNQIQRDDAKRRITVGFNVRGRDVAGIVAELQRKIAANIQFNSGYYVTYGGTFKNLEEARSRLGIAVPVALLLIFMLLYFTFKSVKQSALIFTAIPMSAIGGIFALWIRDMPFSISAGVGFIALFGVAVLNGIVLIAEFNRLKKEGMDSVSEIIKRGTSIRLRPVVLTASVASLGFLPMAISTSAGAEVQKPLATVVIGGLISATVLTLLILPVLYALLEEGKFKLRSTKVTVTIVLLLSFSFSQAQQKPMLLSEKGAVDLALKQSLVNKKALLSVEKAQQAKKGAVALKPLSVTHQDVGVGVNADEEEWAAVQNFGSILNHIQSKQLAGAQYQLAKTQQQLSQRNLVKQTRQIYQQWHYLYALTNLLREQQNTTDQIKGISEKLYESGEIGGLENDLTQLQSLSVQSQKSSVFRQYLAVENRLKQLLQLDVEIIPETDLPARLSRRIENDSILGEFSQVLDQRSLVAQKQVALSKSVYFPQISAGIVQRKTGNAPSFNGFRVGLNVPLSFWSNNAKIKQQKIVREEMMLTNTNQYLAMENEFYSLQKQLTLLEKELHALEPTADKAKAFIAKLKIAYKAGEIDAYKYNQSFETYFKVMQNYLTLIQTYNKTVIDYEFYTKK
ncbi:CusA/CzcA family heavy metal efflux RND transporter [Spongiimicrobium sp. 3-5]|uniref:CusA/CzcA family heavy metal efflux RND transporter n=1 Tax=Spongiimicrobium sp. 3-5 TaxID=3332596 RepID=UPI00397EA00B